MLLILLLLILLLLKVSKIVTNLHWSTKNVNLCLEQAESDQQNHIIDSRVAKTVIPGKKILQSKVAIETEKKNLQ